MANTFNTAADADHAVGIGPYEQAAYDVMRNGFQDVAGIASGLTAAAGGTLASTSESMMTGSQMGERLADLGVAGADAAKEIGGMTDVISFTGVSVDATGLAERVIAGLENSGFHVESVENRFEKPDPETGQKDFRIVASSPDGTKFEYQAHTPESYAAREEAKEMLASAGAAKDDVKESVKGVFASVDEPRGADRIADRDTPSGVESPASKADPSTVEVDRTDREDGGTDVVTKWKDDDGNDVEKSTLSIDSEGTREKERLETPDGRETAYDADGDKFFDNDDAQADAAAKEDRTEASLEADENAKEREVEKNDDPDSVKDVENGIGTDDREKTVGNEDANGGEAKADADPDDRMEAKGDFADARPVTTDDAQADKVDKAGDAVPQVDAGQVPDATNEGARETQADAQVPDDDGDDGADNENAQDFGTEDRREDAVFAASATAGAVEAAAAPSSYEADSAAVDAAAKLKAEQTEASGSRDTERVNLSDATMERLDPGMTNASADLNGNSMPGVDDPGNPDDVNGVDVQDGSDPVAAEDAPAPETDLGLDSEQSSEFGADSAPGDAVVAEGSETADRGASPSDVAEDMGLAEAASNPMMDGNDFLESEYGDTGESVKDAIASGNLTSEDASSAVAQFISDNAADVAGDQGFAGAVAQLEDALAGEFSKEENGGNSHFREDVASKAEDGSEENALDRGIETSAMIQDAMSALADAFGPTGDVTVADSTNGIDPLDVAATTMELESDFEQMNTQAVDYAGEWIDTGIEPATQDVDANPESYDMQAAVDQGIAQGQAMNAGVDEQLPAQDLAVETPLEAESPVTAEAETPLDAAADALASQPTAMEEPQQVDDPNDGFGAEDANRNSSMVSAEATAADIEAQQQQNIDNAYDLAREMNANSNVDQGASYDLDRYAY